MSRCYRFPQWALRLEKVRDVVAEATGVAVAPDSADAEDVCYVGRPAGWENSESENVFDVRAGEVRATMESPDAALADALAQARVPYSMRLLDEVGDAWGMAHRVGPLLECSTAENRTRLALIADLSALLVDGKVGQAVEHLRDEMELLKDGPFQAEAGAPFAGPAGVARALASALSDSYGYSMEEIADLVGALPAGYLANGLDPAARRRLAAAALLNNDCECADHLAGAGFAPTPQELRSLGADPQTSSGHREELAGSEIHAFWAALAARRAAGAAIAESPEPAGPVS